MSGLILALCALTQDAADIDRILEKVRAARPSDADLSFYRHDWAPTWERALTRASAEKRPIFLITNTNISGPTNFYTGHC